jgi:hypothetical protein
MLCGMTTDEVLSPSAVSFIRTTVPRAAEYVALMKKRGRGSVRDLRWLWRMIEDYPHDRRQLELPVDDNYFCRSSPGW